MKKCLFDLFAPHSCCSCGEIGQILCDYCKNDIISETFEGCLACGLVCGSTGLCGDCKKPFSRIWCVGERTGPLKDLVNRYKFERARSAHQALASLLHDSLPQLSSDTVVTSVPTIAQHVRQRGYDHARLLAQTFAAKRQLPYSAVLERASNTVQRGSSRAQRLQQAKQAFSCRPIRAKTYLLIDDIYTTGATVQYAAAALLEAGATEVWVAVVARQPDF